jgi:hypothetical protein
VSAVTRDHLVHLLDVGIEQRRDGADASVVDEHADRLLIPQRALYLREIRLVIEVCRHQSDRASGLARQAGGEVLQPPLGAGDQDEVVSPLCETVGIDGADASGGAGDEGRALRGGITHALPLCAA